MLLSKALSKVHVEQPLQEPEPKEVPVTLVNVPEETASVVTFKALLAAETLPAPSIALTVKV